MMNMFIMFPVVCVCVIFVFNVCQCNHQIMYFKYVLFTVHVNYTSTNCEYFW